MSVYLAGQSSYYFRNQEGIALFHMLIFPFFLQFFEDIGIKDPRVPDLCNKMSEPSPYAILLNCLQRNYGLGDTNIKTSLRPANNPKFKVNSSKFSMTVNEKTVEVFCKCKRDGKQKASQKLLQLLHPNIESWGSLLKMYGSRAITAQKNKKEKESEVLIYFFIIHI